MVSLLVPLQKTETLEHFQSLSHFRVKFSRVKTSTMQCHLHFVNSFSNFVNRERVCSPGDNVKVTVDLNFKAATKIEGKI